MTEKQQSTPAGQNGSEVNTQSQKGINPSSNSSGTSSFAGLRDAARNGELKPQIQRYIFRFNQWMKHPDGIVTRYKEWLSSSWEKWLGLGAGMTGILMLLSPDAFWQWQFLVLIFLMLLAPLLFAFYASLQDFFSAYPGKHFIGEVITLEQPIVDGASSIQLQKEDWIISGPDCAAGTKVKIIALDEKKLYVTIAQ